MPNEPQASTGEAARAAAPKPCMLRHAPFSLRFDPTAASPAPVRRPQDAHCLRACASTRPVRTASAKVSYAPTNELRIQYQAAARLHLATAGMGIDAACETRG